MKRATSAHKEKILQLYFDAFREVPGIVWITGGGVNNDKKVRHLMEFAYETTNQMGEIWMSDDEKAVAFMFYWHKRKPNLYTLWLNLKLIFQVVGLGRTLEIMRREHMIQQERPQNEPYIYLWFIACQSDRTGMESMCDLKNGLFTKAYEERLPIYAETTVEKVVNTYIRYGFRQFYTWKNSERNVNVHFFRREPVPEGITCNHIANELPEHQVNRAESLSA